MEKLTLSAPWITFIHEIQMLFGQDEDIHITVDSESYEVKLFVDKTCKAEALAKLLPEEKVFGNVTVKITVIPANDMKESKVSLIKDAFEGNPVLLGVKTTSTTLGSFNYAVFKKEVVQFFNDQLDDINGNKSMLYQDIAKDVLGLQDGVFFCTSCFETE